MGPAGTHSEAYHDRSPWRREPRVRPLAPRHRPYSATDPSNWSDQGRATRSDYRTDRSNTHMVPYTLHEPTLTVLHHPLPYSLCPQPRPTAGGRGPWLYTRRCAGQELTHGVYRAPAWLQVGLPWNLRTMSTPSDHPPPTLTTTTTITARFCATNPPRRPASERG